MPKTVFVIGAGASYEFGLPVGTELQELISSKTKRSKQQNDFSGLLPSAVGMQSYNINDLNNLIAKADIISSGVQMALSIDNFLNNHKQDAELVAIGKLAIAACILEAERSSTLMHLEQGAGFSGSIPGLKLPEPHNSWLGKLVKYLSAGRDFDKFCDALNEIIFVCFNYDRCIERYLLGAVSLLYPSSQFDASAVLSAANIIHPYGSLGELLPTESFHSGSFGRCTENNVLAASKGIKTFAEGMDSEIQLQIGNAFLGASNVFFLGYGFIAVNDNFIFSEAPFSVGQVIATSFGIKEEKEEHISRKLHDNLLMLEIGDPKRWIKKTSGPRLRSESCHELMERFSFVFE